MKKLFFIYTNPRFLTALYSPVMAREFDHDPQVDVTFLLDQSILKDTLRNNVIPSAGVQRRLERLIQNCQDGGADCVVVGCTAMNLATNALAPQFQIPVISIDEPMVQRIAADGRKRVAILTHAADNGETIQRRLAHFGIESMVFVVPITKEAMDNPQEKTTCFEACAANIEDRFDCIALGHISADDIRFAGLSIPVYRSGRECVAEIKKYLFSEKR